MPNRTKSKSKTVLSEPENGSISEELEVPVASEVVFRKMWKIKKFKKLTSKLDLVDSPTFKCSVNGISTYWNISIRFWKGPNGKKVTNPLVLCLNLTGSETEEAGQARIKYQFGVWDANIRHWECCPISSVILNLENNQGLLSIGYKSLNIHERHISTSRDVKVMVKIQLIQSEEEKHSLSQDLARLCLKNSDEYADTLIQCAAVNGEDTIAAHSLIIQARSPNLAVKLVKFCDKNNNNLKYRLDLTYLSHDLVKEIFRYIYTDKVDNTDAYVNKLLPLSIKYSLPGLTALCERTLLESFTPNNIANILLLADQCGCDSLRKAALRYCEDSETVKGNVHIGKTLAWRVMEMVNPDLFLEACESIGSSSSNLDSPGTPGSYSD